MNGKNKTKGKYKFTKRVGPSLQVIVETQMKMVEVKNCSLCTHGYSMYCTLTMECLRLK